MQSSSPGRIITFRYIHKKMSVIITSRCKVQPIHPTYLVEGGRSVVEVVVVVVDIKVVVVGVDVVFLLGQPGVENYKFCHCQKLVQLAF